MPTHYHFLVRQDGDRSISDFIQAVFNSYTKAFNKMFKRTGTLFEGPFQAIEVSRSEHLIHLCRYIHRNPIDAHLVNHPAHWPFSNYLEWIGQRSGILVDADFVRSWFPSPADYEKFVLEYTPPKALAAEIEKLSFEGKRARCDVRRT